MGVMDDLVAMYEYRYPALAGEILDFGPVALEEGYPHLLVVDAQAAQPACDLAAAADEVGRRLAAVKDGHKVRVARGLGKPRST